MAEKAIAATTLRGDWVASSLDPIKQVEEVIANREGINMGLIGDFKQSLRESAGRILWGQLQDTMVKLDSLEEAIRNRALSGFHDKCVRFAPYLDNMSVDGRIETAIRFQKEARKTFDLNMAEGYALWLTGAWLESMNRPGPDADKTFGNLSRLLKDLG